MGNGSAMSNSGDSVASNRELTETWIVLELCDQGSLQVTMLTAVAVVLAALEVEHHTPLPWAKHLHQFHHAVALLRWSWGGRGGGGHNITEKRAMVHLNRQKL